MSSMNKKHIKKFTYFVLILIPFVLVVFFKKTPTKAVINDNIHKQTVKADLNGNGEEDYIYIELENEQKYHVHTSINDKNYDLIPNKKINSLGKFSSNWPMTLNLLDLDRNNIPEIMIQSSEENVSIQHLFKWTGENFENIFYSTNNILGIIDSNNGKTPKIISFSLTDSKENIQKYMLLNKKLKNISYDSIEPPGLYPIISFIDIISLYYDLSELPNIFTSYIPSGDLSQIWRLEKELYYYTFQDAFFRDIAWNNKGEIITCSWSINFNKISKENNNDKLQVNFTIQLEKVDDTFLISSINLHSKK